MLTGKNKEQFEKWYNDNNENDNLLSKRFNVLVDYAWVEFKNLPLSMQFGVIQDYADSIGYDMTVEGSVDDNLNYTDNYEWSILKKSNNSSHYNHSICKTLDESRTAAIKAFDDIVNQK